MKLINYICAFGICVGSSSCVDMLDRFPLDKISPETYYTSADELRSATNKFYTLFPAASVGYAESFDIVCTFNLRDEVKGTRTIPTSGGGWNFSMLRDINFYLEHSSNCSDADARKQYDGVARFFRAFFYYEKVKRFGDVPYYDKVLASTDAELTKPRDSRDFVMTKVLEDVDYAIRNLPEKKDLYRVTHWTALALKSRICLFEGTYRKYHGLEGADFYLNECVKASDELMAKSGYTIYKSGKTPYQDLFASKDAIIDEVIIARDYDKGKGVVHDANYNTMSTTYGRPGMNKKIVNSYLMKDGSRFTDRPDYKTATYYQEMQNRDPRLTQTVIGPGYMRINDDKLTSPSFEFSTTGYQIIKWVTDASGDGFQGSFNDYIIFRYAEVLLNYAEAKAELGTLTQDDLNRSIKLIRDRVGMQNIDMAEANKNPDPYLMDEENGGYKNVKGANKGVILEIRRERTIELLLEGIRYSDLMRWKEGKVFEKPFLGMYVPELTEGSGENRYIVLDMNDGEICDRGKVDICIYKGTKPKVKNIRKFYKLGEDIELTNGTSGNVLVHDIRKEPRSWNEDRDYLYPIPTEERLLSNGALTQNPGWNDGLSL